MSQALTIVLLPFLVILTYEIITTEHWLLRRHCLITVGCMLLIILAFWIEAPLLGLDKALS